MVLLCCATARHRPKLYRQKNKRQTATEAKKKRTCYTRFGHLSRYVEWVEHEKLPRLLVFVHGARCLAFDAWMMHGWKCMRLTMFLLVPTKDLRRADYAARLTYKISLIFHIARDQVVNDCSAVIFALGTQFPFIFGRCIPYPCIFHCPVDHESVQLHVYIPCVACAIDASALATCFVSVCPCADWAVRHWW